MLGCEIFFPNLTEVDGIYDCLGWTWECLMNEQLLLPLMLLSLPY